MTVREMLARIDSAEITEWQAHIALQNEKDDPGSVEDKIRKTWRPKD